MMVHLSKIARELNLQLTRNTFSGKFLLLVSLVILLPTIFLNSLNGTTEKPAEASPFCRRPATDFTLITSNRVAWLRLERAFAFDHKQNSTKMV